MRRGDDEVKLRAKESWSRPPEVISNRGWRPIEPEEMEESAMNGGQGTRDERPGGVAR